jgi:hypothetical protein
LEIIMKTTLAIAAALMLAATTSNAQNVGAPTDIRVPTGIDVKGSTHYVMKDGTVVQINCNRLPHNAPEDVLRACYRDPGQTASDSGS